MAAEELVLNVKSDIGDVTKDTEKLTKEASNAAGEFKVMGVSLNGVKKAFASAAVTAKGMFGSIKAGLLSTGIGIFLVAIGSLVQYFKDSEEGASKLKQITSALGVVFGNFTDIISNLGKLLFETFSNPKKAIADLWEAIKTNLINRVEGLVDVFKAVGKIIQSTFTLDWEGVKEGMLDYGESLAQVATGVDDVFNKTKNGINNVIDAAKELSAVTKKEIAQAIQLEKDRLALQIFEREAIVEKARTEKDMMELRLKARDFETFAAEERLGFMREANVLAAEQLEKDLFVAKEKLRFQVEENSYSKSTQQNLDDEAALQAAVFNLEKSNFSERKRLKSEEQAIVKEIAANNKITEKERIDSEKLDLQAFTDFKLERIKYETDEEFKIRIEAAKKLANEEKEIAKAVETFKEATIKQGFGAAAAITAENVYLSKGVAAAQVIYNTQQGIMAAMGATSVADKLLPYPLRLANAISTGVMGAAALSTIMSTSPTGGVNNPPPSTGGGGTPAPQMMSGAFDISGGVAPEATKAYVVTDEMSNSQNQLANIRRRATI